MNKGLVSVIIPMYNAEKYIKKAIDSILSQSYKNIEIIIVDDCSTDNSYKIVEAINDNRIQLYKNKINSKISKTLNFALSKTNGEFIARMDADDISIENRLEKQIEYLNKNENLDFCSTAIRFFGEKEQELFYSQDLQRIKDTILTGSPFCHASTVFRYRIKKNLFYKDEFTTAEDLDLFSRLLKQNIIGGNLNEILYLYRITGNQTIFKKDENNKIIENKTQKSIHFKIIRKNIRYIYSTNFKFPNLEECEDLFMRKNRIKNISELKKLAKYIRYLNKNRKKKFYSAQAFNKIFYYHVLEYVKYNFRIKNIIKLVFSKNIIILLLSYKLNLIL